MFSLQELKEIAFSCIDTGYYHKGIDILSQVIAEQPDDAEVYVVRGIGWFRILEADKACADLQKALEIDPDYDEAYHHLADIAIQKEEYEKAGDYYREALKINPLSNSYRRKLVYILSKSRQHAECLALCDKMLSEKRKDQWLLNIKAGIYFRERNFMEALRYTKEAYDLDPTNVSMLNGMGFAYSKVRIVETAADFLDKCLKYQPNDAFTVNNRGYVYLLEKNYAKALDFINRSIHLNPANPYAYYNRAQVYVAQAQTQLAIQDLERALWLDFTYLHGSEAEALLSKLKH